MFTVLYYIVAPIGAGEDTNDKPWRKRSGFFIFHFFT